MADEARLSQQVIEVAYTENVDATARVTGIFVEVIHSTTELTGQLTVDIYGGKAVVTANLSRATNLQFSIAFTGSGSLRALLEPDLEPGNLLQLTQSITTSHILNLTPSSTLELTSAVNDGGRVQNVSASNSISFSQLAVGGKVLSKTVSHNLVLTHNVDESRPVSSILNLTHSVQELIFFLSESVTSDLNLTQTVDVDSKVQYEVSFNGSSELTATIYTEGDRSLTNQLFLEQIAVGTLLQEYVTLQSPYEGPEHVITLPKPLVGNTENLVSDILLKKSMNGYKRTYIKHNNNRRLTYTFSIVREKGLELEYFFKQHNGHSMKLITWEAEIWRVFLITNPLNFNQPRRSAICGPQVEIDLEFEGVKISG